MTTCVVTTLALQKFLDSCRIPYTMVPVGLTGRRVTFDYDVGEFVKLYSTVMNRALTVAYVEGTTFEIKEIP